jgi:hypothetical protein
MEFQHTLDIEAKPEHIYKLYSDVAGWPKWDSEVEMSSISGAFEKGAEGTLKPKGGPQSKIQFIEVKPGLCFTVQSKLPLCIMTFEHELISKGISTTVIHRVTFTGFLSPLFGRLIGKGIQRTLPETMAGLKRAAEAGSKNGM